jgi:hypothetical protein
MSLKVCLIIDGGYEELIIILIFLELMENYIYVQDPSFFNITTLINLLLE